MIDITNIDWMLTINRLTPMLAISLSLVALFSCKYLTSDKTSSTLLHLTIVLLTLLIWADWGSLVFQPSKQTVTARVIMVIILWLVVLLIRKYTRRNAQKDAIIKEQAEHILRLMAENKKLKIGEGGNNV